MMGWLLQAGVCNAAVATVLAVAAFAAARLLRTPPLTRALWLLVLLKLVTPPLWTIHIPVHRASSNVLSAPRVQAPPTHGGSKSSMKAVERFAAPSIMDGDYAQPEDPQPSFDRPASRNAVARNDPARPTSSPSKEHQARRWTVHPSWRWAAGAAWLGGTFIYALLVLRSASQLRRLLRHSTAAPADVVGRAGAIAARLGLRRVPDVRFTSAATSPMLCAIGMRPRLLIPQQLWRQLDVSRRDAVLAHELAHLRRGDHRVRLFELCVSAVYWWLPIVWWARRELREATEQCCDAWVLSELPGAQRRSYAEALLDAIEYLSTAPAAVPALASGMGQFTDLKRRLVMIHRGPVRRALSWPAFAGVCGCAALLLPLAPGLAQQSASENAPAAEKPAAQTTATVDATATSASAPVAAGLPTASQGTPAPTAPIAAGAAPAGLPTATTVAPEAPAGGPAPGAPVAVAADPLAQARQRVEEARARLEQAEADLAIIEHAHGIGHAPPPVFGLGRGRMDAPNGGAIPARGYRAAGRSSEERLDVLEREMSRMLAELRQIRQEMHPVDSNDPTPGELQPR